MAKKKRVTRKKLLKEPDEFLTTSGKVLRYTIDHKTQMFWAMGILAGIIIIASSISYFVNAAENKAFALLDQAMTDYGSMEEIEGDEQAFLEVEKPFQQILDTYGGRKGGKFARLIFADICYTTGRMDKAISLYQQALEDFKQVQPYDAMILKALGYAYEEKKDFAEAIQYFERITSAADELMKDEALFALGRLYLAVGQNEKGIATYKQLIADFPDYMHIEIARDMIGG